MHFFKVEPQCFFRIVVGLQLCFVADFADEERIECRHNKTTVFVSVGEGGEKIKFRNCQSCFFFHFAHQGFVYGFSNIGKASRQVERSLCRCLASTQRQQLSFAVQNEGCNGSTWVQVVFKATAFAAFAFLVLFFKAAAAAYGAVSEFL